MAKRYDSIIVGSGISGLSLSLLLAQNGRKVLLLEKAGRIGGSLARFHKQGVPLDTGFHFTGGFFPGGILTDMLQALGIHERIKPVFLSAPGSKRFILEEDNAVYDIPSGTENLRQALQGYFPAESAAIDKYFSLIRKVLHATATLNLRTISLSVSAIDEDFITLEEVLSSLTANVNLKAILSAYCLCYGAKPSEVSFANHARVVSGLYESVARIEEGGEAFVRAFRDCFAKAGVDILCNASIAECADIKDDRVGRFVLDDGSSISADECIFTIHPHEVLKVLPRQHLKKAFVDRVSSLETTNGFFSVFGVVEGAETSDFGPSITSLLPLPDLNTLLDPGYDGVTALAVIRSVEQNCNTAHCVITAFEPEFYSRLKPWADSSVGRRPAAYQEYKEAKVREIARRILTIYPQYGSSFKVLDAATVLTFRDYLFAPDGNAYGIKQKIGQFNLFGKLPLVNLYACGQSAVLPGIVGAMLSSFIIARLLIGKEKFNQFIERRLSH